MQLQRPDSPPPAAPGTAARRALFVVGLLAVAIVAGFLWWLIRHDPEAEPPQAGSRPVEQTSSAESTTTSPAPTTVQAGPYTFESLTPNQVDRSCPDASYGKVRKWFGDNPCDRVVRGLYTTRQGQARAIVAISVVTMPTPEQAQHLKALTDTSGTGNVSDLLRDGSVHVPGAPKVAGGNYASSAAGNTVTIIESSFYDGHRDQPLLDDLTTQALRVAAELR